MNVSVYSYNQCHFLLHFKMVVLIYGHLHSKSTCWGVNLGEFLRDVSLDILVFKNSSEKITHIKMMTNHATYNGCNIGIQEITQWKEIYR